MNRNIDKLLDEYNKKFIHDTRTNFYPHELLEICEKSKNADGNISIISLGTLCVEVGIVVGYNMRKAEEKKNRKTNQRRPDPKQLHDRSAAPGQDQTGTQDHSCAGQQRKADPVDR